MGPICGPREFAGRVIICLIAL